LCPSGILSTQHGRTCSDFWERGAVHGVGPDLSDKEVYCTLCSESRRRGR